MFAQLAEVAKGIHLEILQLYWILLVPLVLILIIFEFFKSQKNVIDVFEILRRVVISIFLLMSFSYTINVIGMIGDGIIEKVDSVTDVWETLKNLGPNYKDSSSGLFDLRGHILYVFALLAYIIAYLGFFIAEALTHFVWVVLYTISPLMILAYVSPSTANITSNLYKGLVKVIVWKSLWSILGVLLLTLAMNPQTDTIEDYFISIVMNLCIGLSMLFIPIATRSLINDGMESAASAIAAVPTMAVATAGKFYAKKAVKSGAKKSFQAGRFASRPITNPITSRANNVKEKYEPKFRKIRDEYKNINNVNNNKNKVKQWRRHV